jgi:hypothetical protein
MNKWIDNILTTLFVFAFVTIVPTTYAYVNVTTRPEMITVKLELPSPGKPVMIVYDVIDPEPGKLLDPPKDFPIYWEWKASGIEDYTTYIDIRDNYPEMLSYAFHDDPSIHTNERAYTDDEYFCMVQNVYFEAGVEGTQGRLAVAMVTLERVKDPRYPNNICDVVYENKQFSWYWDGKPDRPQNMKAYEEIRMLVGAILDADAAFVDPTYDSTHYHANYVKPYWKDYMVYKATVETHIFYREEPEKIASL